jgi:hypothetical protein
VARVSAATQGSLTPDQILGELGYADAIRLYNQWWLDAAPENRLATVAALAPKSIKGLFSPHG